MGALLDAVRAAIGSAHGFAGSADDLPERPPELTAQTVVGGVYEVIHTRVVERRAA